MPGLTLGVLLLAGALAAVEAEGAAVVGEGVVNAAIVISHIVDAEVLAVDGHGALRADAGSLLGLVARLDAAGGEEHHAEQHKGDDDGGIDAGGAALLRLLLGLAGLAGIDVAGFVQLLTSLLFSRCTHGQWFPFKLLFVIKVYRAERRNDAARWGAYFVPKMRSPAIPRRCAARNPCGDQNRRPMTRPAARFCCAKRLNAPSGADGAAGWRTYFVPKMRSPASPRPGTM